MSMVNVVDLICIGRGRVENLLEKIFNKKNVRGKEMLKINNIKMPVKHNENDLKNVVCKLYKINKNEIKSFEIAGQAIDARKKNNVVFVYAVNIELENEKKFENIKNIKKFEKQIYSISKIENFSENEKIKRPVVVGSGPAGIFAGLVMAEAGLKPIIIEQGKNVDERKKDVYNFFKTRKLNKYSNVQFGEGGAGTFSDGKLNTNTNNFRMQKIYDELILAGAEKKISYMSKPHIGTDKLIGIMKNIRKKIESLGGEYRFCTKLTKINYENNKLKEIEVEDLENEKKYTISTNIAVLAIGHSARETFYMLNEQKVQMERKIFSVGVRIEHKQSMINRAQYGKFADKLPSAEYKLNVKTSNGRGVYTFCMCPGGVVVPSASEENRLVVNGMSYSKRNLENANSAILVNVFPDDFEGNSVLAGIEFQRKLEEKAFILGGSDYKAPVQLFGDFLNNKVSKKLGNVKPSYLADYKFADLNQIFPEYINSSLKEGITLMDKKIKGFANYDAILTGVESRSSSPVKIPRNEKFFANIEGIMPCGEGAGYAGGIMSAAVDGVKCAEFVVEYFKDLMSK
ncbi:NAD(P)/FAD-dependent oxidoreductase [Leptotrichia sp. oral taxon 498]|uniref:NAD(P)/FAD-dependent oxidoreductase n=1 Tax=Leptotrichia sp. oral taxon 498 TaxID=712368 RepID=UPI003001DEA4